MSARTSSTKLNNTKSNNTKPIAQPTVLVLWSYRCDEVTTLQFVSHLRDVGLRVQLVGLDGRACVGRVGVKINTDCTLGEWLKQAVPEIRRPVQRLLAVVLPFDQATLQRCAADERFLTLLQQAHDQQTRFVIRQNHLSLFTALFNSPYNSPCNSHCNSHRPQSDISPDVTFDTFPEALDPIEFNNFLCTFAQELLYDAV